MLLEWMSVHLLHHLEYAALMFKYLSLSIKQDLFFAVPGSPRDWKSAIHKTLQSVFVLGYGIL